MVLTKEIDDYLHYCEFRKNLDRKTVRAYRIDLRQFAEFMEQHRNEVTKETLNLYLVHIHSYYKQKSIKRKIASVKAFYHYLEDEELIELNPFHKVKTKFKEETVLPRIIPRNIIEQMLDYLYKEEDCSSTSSWQKRMILRDIAVIEMLFATGLRISELCSLRDQAFDTVSGTLTIRGKGGKERCLQIGSADVLNVLKEYKNCFVDDIKEHGFFFVNRYGKPLSEQSARRMIHKYSDAIGAGMNITPHMFRHSFATYLMEEDINIRYIQKMLGHASITTTQIYTYVSTEKEKELLRTRHPRNKMHVGRKN